MALKLPKYSDLQSQKEIKTYANTYSIIEEKAKKDAMNNVLENKPLMPKLLAQTKSASGGNIVGNILKNTKKWTPSDSQSAKQPTKLLDTSTNNRYSDKINPLTFQKDILISKTPTMEQVAKNILTERVSKARDNIAGIYNGITNPSQTYSKTVQDTYDFELENSNKELYNSYIDYLGSTNAKDNKDSIKQRLKETDEKIKSFESTIKNGNKTADKSKTYIDYYDAKAYRNALNYVYLTNYEEDYTDILKSEIKQTAKKKINQIDDEIDALRKKQFSGNSNDEQAKRLQQLYSDRAFLYQEAHSKSDSKSYNARDKELAEALKLNATSDPQFNDIAMAERTQRENSYNDITTESPYYKYFNDEEKNILNYYTAKGNADSVKKYYKSIERTLSERQATEQGGVAIETAKDATLKTAIDNIFRSPITISKSTEAMISQIVNNVKTGENRSADPNAEGMRMQREATLQRKATSELVYDRTLEKTNSKAVANVAAFGSDIATSIGEQAWYLALGPQGGLMMIAASSASQSFYEGAVNGRSAGTALAVGVASGAIEYLTEKMGLDQLLDTIGGGKTVTNFAKPITNYLMTGLKSMGVQGLTESFEESISFIANEALDNMAYGSQSEFNKYVDYLMQENNLSKNEAVKKTLVEYTLTNLGMSALGGFVAGGIMGGFGAVAGNFNDSANWAEQNANWKAEQASKKAVDINALNPAAVMLNVNNNPMINNNQENIKEAAKYINKANKLFKEYGIKNAKADLQSATFSDGSRIGAFFDPATSTIHISNDITDKNVISKKIVHEGFHAAETTDIKLVGDLLSIMQENGVDIPAKIAEAKTLYTNALTELYQNQGATPENALAKAQGVVTDDYTSKEIAAAYLSELLDKTDILAEIEKTRPNFIQRVYNWIVNTINSFKMKGTDTRETAQYQKLADKLRSLATEQSGVNINRNGNVLPTYAEEQARKLNINTNGKLIFANSNNYDIINNNNNYIKGDETNGRTEERATGEETSTPRGDARISGYTQSFYDTRLEKPSSLDGRKNNRGIENPIITNPEISSILTDKGITPIKTTPTDDAHSFYNKIGEAKNNNPYSAFVTQHSIDEYKNMNLFLNDDETVGVAVTKDGDIVSVFKNSNNKVKNAVSSILLTALENGGNKLDNFDGTLSKMYHNHGFIPVARVLFSEDQNIAPLNWDYKRDGKPDIIFWVHNGDSVVDVAKKIGNYGELPDLKSLPLMEYDEAGKYRDSLIPKINKRYNTNNFVLPTYTEEMQNKKLSVSKNDGKNKPKGIVLPTYAEEQARKAKSNTNNTNAVTPTDYNGKRKISKVRTNTYEKLAIWDDAERSAEGMAKENFEYDKKPEKQSIKEAIARLNKDFDSEAETLKAKELWAGADLDTAMGILAKHTVDARENGDYSTMQEWAKLIQTKGTLGGQFVQAFAKYSRTPQGILVRSADILSKTDIPKGTQKKTLDDMADVANSLDAIRDGDIDTLIKLILKMAKIRKTKASKMILKSLKAETDFKYLYDFAIKQFESVATDFIKPTSGRKASTIQTIAQLLNLRTTARNIISNQLLDVFSTITNDISIVPDAVLSMITGKRSTALQTSWLSKAKREGARQGARRSSMEVSLDVTGGAKTKYNTIRRTFKARSSKVLTNLEKALGYELNVTDEFHKGSVRAETYEGLKKLVDKGYMTNEEALELSEQEALYRSLQDDTYVGGILNAIKSLFNTIGVGDSGSRIGKLKVKEFGLGDFVQKYTKVPGALITRSIEFSPLGYIKTITTLAQARLNGKLKNMDISTQRKTAHSIGRATTGSGLIVAFVVLAKAGLIKWMGEEEDKDTASLLSSEGVGGTQFNISATIRALSGSSTEWKKDDVLYDIGFLEPFDTLMTIGTLIAQNENNPDISNITNDTLKGITESIIDTPTMTTISDIYNTVKYYNEDSPYDLPIEIGITFATNSVTSFVPSLLRQIAQATDAKYRDTYSSSNVLIQGKDALFNTIPGLRQTLPTKLTNYGTEKKYTNPWLNALNALASPGNMNLYQQTDASKELLSIKDKTENATIVPDRNAPYSVVVGNTSHKLSDKDRRTYQKTRGVTSKATIDTIIASDTYKKGTLQEKESLFNEARLFSNDVAMREFCQNNGIVYKNTSWEKTIEVMQDGVDFATFRSFEYSTKGLATKQTKEYLRNLKVSEAEKATIYDSLYDGDLYDKLITSAIDKVTAYNIADGIAENEYTKDFDKGIVIANSPLPEGDKLKALSYVFDESTYKKAQEAHKNGVSMYNFTKFKKAVSDMKGVTRLGKVFKTKQDQVTEYINKMNISAKQKSTLYLQYYSESSLENTPWYTPFVGIQIKGISGLIKK